MNNLAVDPSRLTGFQLDLQDIAANASSNAARFHSAIVLPTGASGLLATLAAPLEKFRAAHSGALQSDTTAMDTIGTNLATSATSYRATDDGTATALAATNDSVAAGSASTGNTRFGGLQLPGLPEVADDQFTLKQLVTTTIAQLSPYDEPLSVALGIKPTEEYLTPLLGDWESIETIGRRIAMLGTNDYVAAQNIVNGSTWLNSEWSGEAAQSFTTTTGTLGQTMGARSTDLESTAKIVENGGACLERLVYNQATDLTDRILRAIAYNDASFPLGAWAARVNDPLPAELKTQITTGIDELTTAARARKDAITTLLGTLSTALDYSPGRTAPAYNPADFEQPDKVVTDPGARRYGIGNTTWWEEGGDDRV
ncbi:type VII secretion target [Nocardia asteroides]|uniref:type VII secretion target n=1 Tax=Nocardia asteroides TaxID=1824 RepID=UPI001E33FFD8|nr:type VII secretion target [Nocardia asteroides]UGT57504.1 hypothetical protein LTT85_11955 [Nocardia asteroides]